MRLEVTLQNGDGYVINDDLEYTQENADKRLLTLGKLLKNKRKNLVLSGRDAAGIFAIKDIRSIIVTPGAKKV